MLNQINVDIILPNYNSSLYIEETLNSIVGQSFKNWKLLIVDDNSNGETKNIIKRYVLNKKIKIIWLRKNKGVGFCRNLAMRNAKSEYIAFIDSDDIWEKEKLAKQLDFMIKNKHCFTYTNYQPFIDDKKEKKLKEIAPESFFTFEKFIRNKSHYAELMKSFDSFVVDDFYKMNFKNIFHYKNFDLKEFYQNWKQDIS